MEKKMKILVALKFIENPDDLLNKALKIGARYNARIYIIHVLQDMPRLSFYSDAYQLWEEFRDKAVKETIRQMNNYIEPLSEQYNDIEPVVDVGDAAQMILEAADRLGVDLIVVGNHSRTGFKHLVHHNVGEKVVRMSKIPVLSFFVGEE